MLIGISGKSGSGKTKIAEALSTKLGADIISFDKVCHLSIEKESFKQLVREKISTDVFDAKGNIVRKKLGEIVFADKEKLQLINQHSEKIMIAIIDELIKTNKKPYLILEYALLPLMKYFNMCQFKILVTANEAIRCERIMNRDGVSEEYFKKREANSISYIPALFDVVVENHSNEERSVENVINLIKEKELSC
jgi:dephospho-CoA kinase